MVRRCLGKECTIETNAAPNVEITMLRREAINLICLLHHPGGLAGGMSRGVEAQPVREERLRVKAAQSPAAVTIQPDGAEPEWSWREADGNIEILVDEVDILQLVVIELDASETE
jgi:hypothetical protein